ncbi:MAG TPA: CoA pyrophosphatase [Dermatophilaceae bacterium]|nr:CoA pyrophosphatase [Dermatophilaceae bacterium]
MRSAGEGAGRPEWMARVARELGGEHLPEYFRRFAPPSPPPEGLRRSAVLMLFGPAGGGGEDVLLTERALSLRAHPGQVSFPGGSVDSEDDGPVAAALREGQEEVGLDPSGVDVVLTLPDLFLAPSSNVVTPVLAWWAAPVPVGPVDAAEVAAVARVPVADLLDPRQRFTATHPAGYRGPAFDAGGMFVWGFTALLLSTLFELAGIATAWDPALEREIPEHILTAWMRHAR